MIVINLDNMDDDDDIFDDTPLNEDNEENSEQELQKRKEERAKQLGFAPQNEIVYNSLLPYSDKFDEESKEMWEEIKTNLGKAVALRELRPAFVMWNNRLTK